MRQKLSRFLSSAVLSFWPYFLLLSVAGAALSISASIRLFQKINTDPEALLPGKDENVISLLLAKKKLERGIRCSFVIESDDRAANIKMVEDLAIKLKAFDKVARVEQGKTGFEFFDRFKLLFADLSDLQSIRDRIARKILKEKLVGLYFDLEHEGGKDEEFSFKDIESKYKSKYPDNVTSPYYESPDGRIFLLVVESPPGDTGLAASSAFYDDLVRFSSTIKPASYHPSMKIYVSGPTKVFEYRSLLRDLIVVGIVSSILLCIPLLLRFRRIVPVTAIFLPLLVALPISFAVAKPLVGQLNLVTSFLFAILGGLGVENGIHIFSRYHESRMEGVNQREALREIFSSVMPAILTSVAAVSCTLFALMFTDFRGFSEFGFISGIGLWVILGVYLVFLPSLLILIEKMRLMSFSAPEKSTSGSTLMLSKKVAPTFVVFCLVCGVISLFLVPSIRFEYDSKKTRPILPGIFAIKEKQRQTQKRVNNPALVVIHSKEEADALKEAVEKIVSNDKVFPTVEESRSYYDLLPADQMRKLKVIREIEKLLEDKAIKMMSAEKRKDLDRFRKIVQETRRASESDIPPDLKYIFKGNAGVPGEIFYVNAIPSIEMDDGKNAIRFAEDVATIKTSLGTYHPSNDAIIYGKILKSMLSSAPRILILSFFVVMFFVFLEFRRWAPTALVMGSISIGVLWMLGVLAGFGIPLTFYNIIIVPAVLGMSVDNAIHIVHRHRELGPGSVGTVLKSSGRAALLASLTNASGFVGLLFCQHKGLYTMGMLAVIGVLTCLVSTLLFLPATLQCLEMIQWRRRPLMEKGQNTNF